MDSRPEVYFYIPLTAAKVINLDKDGILSRETKKRGRGWQEQVTCTQAAANALAKECYEWSGHIDGQTKAALLKAANRIQGALDRDAGMDTDSTSNGSGSSGAGKARRSSDTKRKDQRSAKRDGAYGVASSVNGHAASSAGVPDRGANPALPVDDPEGEVPDRKGWPIRPGMAIRAYPEYNGYKLNPWTGTVKRILVHPRHGRVFIEALRDKTGNKTSERAMRAGYPGAVETRRPGFTVHRRE